MEKLDRVFSKFANNKNVNSAIAFVENSDGTFSWNAQYGDRSLDTPMIMASVTKLFTTACILILKEQGKLCLEDKISNYLNPDIISKIHLFKGKDNSSKLTIYHLLFQSSGLPGDSDVSSDSLLKKISQEDLSYTFNEMIDLTKKHKCHFAPCDDKAYYADINFDLLGEIIEKVSGYSLKDAYNKFIFEPLHLEHTYLPTSEKEVIPDVYYKNKLISCPKLVISSRASGGCISNARDLMVFIKSFFKGKLFDKEVFKELSNYRKLQASMGPINYGGGYMQILLKGALTAFNNLGEMVGHSGSSGSFAFYYPSKDLYFVGDMCQFAKPALPIQFLIKSAFTYKNSN